MAQKVEIVRGTTNTFQITVRDADGKAYTTVGDEKVIFGIKAKPTDPEVIFVKTATGGTDGVYNVTIAPGDTKDLDPGRYFYDVALQSGDNFFNIIEPNPFIIEANVTKWGDGA